MRMTEDEDFLRYLDTVKFRFGSSPQTYRDFLKILQESYDQQYVIHFVFIFESVNFYEDFLTEPSN